MSDSVVTARRVLETLTGYVAREECILFLGAAIHAAPPEDSTYVYPEAQRPAMAGKLTKLLGQECGFEKKFPEEPLTLMRVALCYEMTPGLGRSRLVDSLSNHLQDGKTASRAVEMLAQLPFRIYVTTNYDRLLEDALRTVANKDPTVIIYNPDPKQETQPVSREPTAQQPLLLKMHGDLSKRESIVITDEDYITFVQRMSDKDPLHPVPMLVRYRMQMWPTLFLGYSLRDFNLRLLFRTLRWRVDPAAYPPAFSVDRNPDPLILKVWQDQRQIVTFVSEDLWSCVPWLADRILEKEHGS